MSFFVKLDEARSREMSMQALGVYVSRSGALTPSRQGGFGDQVYGLGSSGTRNALDPTLIEEFNITPERLLELWNDKRRQLTMLTYKGCRYHPDHFDIVAEHTAEHLSGSKERIFNAASIEKPQKQPFDGNKLHNSDATMDIDDEADAPDSPVEDIPRPAEVTTWTYLGRLNEKQSFDMPNLYGSFTTVEDEGDASHSPPNRSLDGLDTADSELDCNLACEVDSPGSPVSDIPQPVQAAKGVCLDLIDGSNQSNDCAGGAMTLTASSSRPGPSSPPLRSLRTRHRDETAGVTFQEERSSGGPIGRKVSKKRKADCIKLSDGQDDALKKKKVVE